MSFLAVLYLFLPAFLANATPVVVCAVPSVRRHNRPVLPALLGHHKTAWGFGSGIAAGILTGVAQWSVRDIVPLTTLQHTLTMSIVIGALLSAGALIGDAVESAIKRACGLPSGAPLVFWDNVDYMIGSIVLVSFVYVPPIPSIVGLLIVGPLLSVGANVVSYWLGIKKVWY